MLKCIIEILLRLIVKTSISSRLECSRKSISSLRQELFLRRELFCKQKSFLKARSAHFEGQNHAWL